MANKENLSPHAATLRYLAQGANSQPPVKAQLASKAPFFGLSPSRNPVLSQQRDHSACKIADSPLKVRKTRENLRDHNICTDIPPPCAHGVHTDTRDIATEQLDNSGSTLVDTYENEYPAMRPLTPVPPPGRIQRHKSVSRRMFSRVREGISQRSRSSQSMRGPSGSDTGLMRKTSGKCKQSLEEQPRLRSFEISRDSIDSLVDGDSVDVDPAVPDRSFTDCSVSTDNLMSNTTVVTPLHCSPLAPKTTTHTRQYSGRLLSPSPPPRSGDATPRAAFKSIAFGLGHEISNLQATTPFVDLSVSVDRSTIDVDVTKDIWIAVVGTVRSQVVEASNTQSTEITPLRKRSMDAIIIVAQDVFKSDKRATHKCIVELCSRLNIAGDRLAVLCARVQKTGTSTVNCECEQLHALQTPILPRLFERLGIAPSTANTIFEEHWESLPESLQSLTERGLRKDRAQTFIISTEPNLLVQIVDHLVQWPAHSIKIGLASERSVASTPRTRHNWAFQIDGEGDDAVVLYDNMIRDLRHGCPMGTIRSLRMCYKPMQGCQVLEVLGQKALKDVRLGQRCSLFLKVQIPRIDTSRPSLQNDVTETDSLFAELESIVGTLETNFIHIEARYRQSLLPSESVVTVRQICNVRRPKFESRWSTVGREGDASNTDQVRIKLAQFLAMHYHPARALRMIDRWVLQHTSVQPEAVQQIRKHLGVQISAAEGSRGRSTSISPGSEKPSVVITDIDSEVSSMSASTSRNEEPSTRGPSASSSTPTQPVSGSSALSPKPSITAVRAISAAKTTTAITIAGSEQTRQSLEEGEDSARQLWRHIRHHSLSAKQLEEITPIKLRQLEASDENIKALRHRALSNKRSIGAETLRAWKWEEKAQDSRDGEAPWL